MKIKSAIAPTRRGLKMKSGLAVCLVAMLLIFPYPENAHALSAQTNNINISMKNASLKEVLWEIEKRTDFVFAYNVGDIDGNRKLNIDVNAKSLEETLAICLKGTGLTYVVEQNVIVLKKSEEPRVQDNKTIVTGKVTDNKSVPLPGASIIIKGTTTGASSGTDGTWSLEIPDGRHTLVFSFIGMDTQEIPFKGQTVINVTMLETQSELEDVVVTGYQTISRERATGSFSKVTSEELETQRLSDLGTLLEGRIAGFSGGLLRGTTSMRGMTTPLYVIDGFPIENTRYSPETFTITESIPDLNLDDIESVTILKDAAATSIYGARAANGVVVVVTKKAKQGKTRMSFSTSLTVMPYSYYTDNLTDAGDIIALERGWADGNPYLKESGAADYAANLLKNASYTSFGMQALLNYHAGNISEQEKENILNDLASKGYQYYDQVEKYAKRNPVYQQYNLSIGKSVENNSFNASVTYRNNKYEDIQTKDESAGINLRNSTKLADWLSVDMAMYTLYTTGKTQTFNIMSPGFTVMPYNYLADGTGNNYVSTAEDRLSYDYVNNINVYGLYSMDIDPLGELGMNLKKNKDFLNRAEARINIKFADELKYMAMFQYEYGADKTTQLKSENSYEVRNMVNKKATISSAGGTVYNLPYGNIFYSNNQYSNAYTFRQQVDFNKTFVDRHDLTFIAGSETRHSKLEYAHNYLYNYVPDMLNFETVNQKLIINTSGTIIGNITMGSSDFHRQMELVNRFVSFYGNAGYTFDNKYTVTGSLRWDRSNLWGTDNKYQKKPVWSAGAGWNIDKENFLSAPWIDMLKLRASYGIGGNIAKNSAPYMTANYSTNTSVGGTQGNINSRPNPQLSWEKTTTTNVGVDFSFFKQRLTGAVEVYNKLGSDLLANTSGVPTEGWGYSTYTINNGKMRNRGFEVTLNSDIVSNRNFGWNVSVLYGYNKNQVTDVSSKAPHYSIQMGNASAYPIVGNPYNAIYGYKWAGLSTTGLVQVYDAEGNPTSIDPSDLDAVVYCGTAAPTHSGSFSTLLRYGNLELSVLFTFKAGHKIRNTNVPMLRYGNVSAVNKKISNAWKQPGDEARTNIPRVVYSYDTELYNYQHYDLYTSYSDVNVINASHVKLNNVSLIYRIPVSLINRIGVQNARLNFNIENLCMFASGKDAKYMLGGYNPPRFVCGLNVNF